MELTKENRYKIKINKYKREDVILTGKGIYILAKDTQSAKLRLPKLKNKKHFIPANQIADYGKYLYIPDDQIPKEIDLIYEYTKPLASQEMQKAQWKNIKEKHLYQITKRNK
jgi:hypothetical protein